MSLYDLFFPREHDDPEDLTDEQQAIIDAARKAGQKIDGQRVRNAHLQNVADRARRGEVATGSQDLDELLEAERARASETLRQEAIRRGFLPPDEESGP